MIPMMNVPNTIAAAMPEEPLLLLSREENRIPRLMKTTRHTERSRRIFNFLYAFHDAALTERNIPDDRHNAEHNEHGEK